MVKVIFLCSDFLDVIVCFYYEIKAAGSKLILLEDTGWEVADLGKLIQFQVESGIKKVYSMLINHWVRTPFECEIR